MGVPCVTLAGGCHAHNVGVTLLSAIGLQADWVAQTRDEYIRIATAAAANIDKLCALRARLRSVVLDSALCDAAPFLRGLEGRLRECFARWRSGGNSVRSSASGDATWHGDGGAADGDAGVSA